MSGYYLRDWVGSPGKLEIFEFNINDSSGKEVARAMREAGLQITATQLRKNIDYLGVYFLNVLAKEAKISVEETIPWDSNELLQSHIGIDDASEGSPVACVYIDDSNHYGSRRKLPEEASGLAMFLDEPTGPNNDLHRSNTSHGGQIAAGSPTAGWIADAQLDFQSRKQQILRGVI